MHFSTDSLHDVQPVVSAWPLGSPRCCSIKLWTALAFLCTPQKTACIGQARMKCLGKEEAASGHVLSLVHPPDKAGKEKDL